ncbi:MAG TPA: hypothetical protein VEG37_09330 [Burkholderiales bacterium]|nr:hypothetical protein [Burkholderiales bacterium]
MVSNHPSLPWIISRRDDLLWFQGSVIAGLFLLVFFVATPYPDSAHLSPSDPVILVVFLWGVLFDGTHVWATYARSYLAPDTNSRAGIPKPRWWLILAIGPVFALTDAALRLQGTLFSYFLLAAYLWAYWHLVRQHYGFLALYRRRAGENDQRGQSLDSFMLWAGCLYPFIRFSLGEPYLHSGLPQLVPSALLPQLTFILDVAFCLLMGAAVILAVSGRYEPFRPGPKHLLLAIVIVFHMLVFALLSHLLTILATLTIFHNLQYHRIVWQYEAGCGRRPLGGLVPYLAGGLLLGLVWYGLRVPTVVALTSETARNVVLGLCWGVAFHHYLVDARIWRVRRSPALAQALNVGAVQR